MFAVDCCFCVVFVMFSASLFIFLRRSFITDNSGSADRPIEIPEDVVDWTKFFGELSDDSDIEVFESLGLPLQRHPPQTGVGSPPSREEGGSPDIPLIRKRKAVVVAETSSRSKAARLDTSDPIFSDLSPLSQPKSSHPISVGELGNMEVGSSHVGDVVRPSPSTMGVASTSEAGTNTLQRDVRIASGSTAGSSGSVERNWIRKYNKRVDGAFSAAASVQSKSEDVRHVGVPNEKSRVSNDEV
ncbi:hypothetical protein COLO4_20376 [Corchorus olitorius]|uniref:Uncharacterized protein n=1 Tax=Corchorus olitorius TaxID=93759 RepID=A0A1R3J040_9ROSI|nr:hypothetical protein COLO4_20376 [Corchorus olitorius]